MKDRTEMLPALVLILTSEEGRSRPWFSQLIQLTAGKKCDCESEEVWCLGKIF
jgi:hypothetical protein